MNKLLVLVLSLALTQPSCIVAGGYSSESGWFIWPGSLFALLVIVILFFVLRRRK